MIIVQIFKCLIEAVVLFIVVVGLAWQLLYSLSPINNQEYVCFKHLFNTLQPNKIKFYYDKVA